VAYVFCFFPLTFFSRKFQQHGAPENIKKVVVVLFSPRRSITNVSFDIYMECEVLLLLFFILSCGSSTPGMIAIIMSGEERTDWISIAVVRENHLRRAGPVSFCFPMITLLSWRLLFFCVYFTLTTWK
jgi:hypothetical protein